ncbi:flavodoxin family protein [Pseudonocardia sp. GCM10023141]|uniref:flavodoxin family protein n=1 Tax=Pseudonocardia sp. GCM10023141 TaxID=3252653 RepID=UPI003622CD56
MQAVVVVESVFGNTRAVAEAIAEGLAKTMNVRVLDVSAAPASTAGIDLLVVGGPTHVFGLTRHSTRESAAEQSGGAVVAAAIGLRDWLDDLPGGSALAAAFDTRTDHPRLPGSAAGGAVKRLRRRGYRMIADPETFRVLGTKGPLLMGEPERARAWGALLGSQLVPTA